MAAGQTWSLRLHPLGFNVSPYLLGPATPVDTHHTCGDPPLQLTLTTFAGRQDLPLERNLHLLWLAEP